MYKSSNLQFIYIHRSINTHISIFECAPNACSMLIIVTSWNRSPCIILSIFFNIYWNLMTLITCDMEIHRCCILRDISNLGRSPGHVIRQEKVPEPGIKRNNAETSNTKKPLFLLCCGIPHDGDLIGSKVSTDPVNQQRILYNASSKTVK